MVSRRLLLPRYTLNPVRNRLVHISSRYKSLIISYLNVALTVQPTTIIFA